MMVDPKIIETLHPIFLLPKSMCYRKNLKRMALFKHTQLFFQTIKKRLRVTDNVKRFSVTFIDVFKNILEINWLDVPQMFWNKMSVDGLKWKHQTITLIYKYCKNNFIFVINIFIHLCNIAQNYFQSVCRCFKLQSFLESHWTDIWGTFQEFREFIFNFCNRFQNVWEKLSYSFAQSFQTGHSRTGFSNKDY